MVDTPSDDDVTPHFLLPTQEERAFVLTGRGRRPEGKTYWTREKG